ncbi:hypothetical protein HNP69_000628 [Chryseobacterium koreense]|nr:hypothetical protein [Chryseobacterium koreense]
MCDIAKIRCQIIDGFVKTKSYHIGNTGILDHSWNAVIIDNQTYFVDLTWAAGYCESNEKGKLTQFVQKKNDFYWFTPVEKFTVDHFPKNPEKIQDFQISKEDYRDQPYIAKEIVPFIEIQFPKQGILKPKIGDSINFSFKYPENIHKIQINTNLKRNPKFYFTNKNGESVFNQKAYLKQDYVDFQNINGLYRFSYFVENDELRYIEILFDYNLKMKYLVRIEN